MRKSIIAVLVTLLMSVQQSAAGMLSAEVGLDDATIAMINNLPETWRPQIDAIVGDAMSRADASVSSYLQQLNDLALDAIVAGQCALTGSSSTLADELRRVLPFTGDDPPLEALSRKIQNAENGFGGGVAVTLLTREYADLAYAAALVKCQFGISAAAQLETDRYVNSLNRKLLSWQRLALLDCTKAEECLVTYRDVILKQIENVDPGAATVSDASVRLQSVAPPESRGFWFWEADPIDRYEKVLFALKDVEDSLLFQQARHMRGRSAYDTAADEISRGKQKMDDAVNKAHEWLAAVLLRPRRICETLQAMRKPGLDDAENTITPARDRLMVAANLVPDLAASIAGQIDAMNRVQEGIRTVRAQC